ncbi:MAG: terminase [Deltaproteobacteria bacterium]|nr:terminase [Deltaproteobacteria bacterium]
MEQMRLWNENRRFAVVPAGRRSGKTELAKRRLVFMLPVKKDWPDARYFAAAPTRGQAKRIFWSDLKALIPAKWIKRVYETELCVTTIFGSEIWVVGLDRPQRIEGTPWDGGVLDEYADMKPGVWTENIRPALADRGGWCWFIGVPEGLNHYKDLADYAASGVDADWGFYTWRSSDIVAEPEVEGARRILDPRTFRQEYEASFEGRAGRVYYAYDAKRHVDAGIEVDPKLPIAVCCDFNVDPCVWELAQTDGRLVLVFDEIALRDTNTYEMCKEFLRRYGRHRAGFVVHGDAAGSARSTAGKSDYAIMMEMGFKDQRVKRSNPAVRDRVNAVNSMLRNAREEVRLTHHPRCAQLRKDFEKVEWTDGGVDIDKARPELTHAADALGYFVAAEFPLTTTKRDPARRFYK